MLSTGIRTPVGAKIFGPDIAGIEHLAKEVEAVVKTIPGTSSAYSERLGGGRYLEIEPNREQIARYGLSIADVEEVVATALGGETVTTTVEGRERYGVIVRYPRDLRDNPQAIGRDVLVSAGNAMVPLGSLASIRVTQGPPSIRTENAELVAYLYVDMHGRDIGSFVADADKAVRAQVKLPPGYRIQWSGQY
jgi:copper/silver efflux system protein